MQIKNLLTICCLSFSTPLLASPLIDSIGVENNNGKEVVIHKIDPKETYYSLSRKYDLPVKAIMDFNASKPLHPGMTVKIPTEREFGKKAVQAVVKTTTADEPVIEYKVGPKETLYFIAKRFNTTIEDIKQLNNMSGNTLSVGQVIKVHQGKFYLPSQTPPPQVVKAPVVVAPQPEKPTIIAPIDTTASDAETKFKQNRYGLRQNDEKGVGVWIDDQNLDGSKMLALHRTVPPGTVIKVTNPMTGISAYVKVLGKFTENETTKDVIIVLTKAVADRIGILDKRFQINIVYGIPNEN